MDFPSKIPLRSGDSGFPHGVISMECLMLTFEKNEARLGWLGILGFGLGFHQPVLSEFTEIWFRKRMVIDVTQNHGEIKRTQKMFVKKTASKKYHHEFPW